MIPLTNGGPFLKTVKNWQVQNTGRTGQIESKKMAMQRDFWVKDGVWEKIAVQRDFWVNDRVLG